MNKQFTWKFVEELERPRVIRAYVAPFNTRDNLFAQLVVRLKSKQVINQKVKTNPIKCVCVL